MKKILFIIFCATFLLVSCTSITEYNSKSIFVFDTVVNMRFYNAENPDKHYEDIKKMLKEISAYSSDYESYDDKSVYDLNEKRMIDYNDYLAEMINYAYLAKEKTKGYFEPLIGNLSRIWKNAIEKKVYPDEDIIKEELANINSSAIEIKENEYIKINGNANLDLGGFVKGYASYKIKEYLENNNIKYYLINLGESNILLSSKLEESFIVAFRNPLKDEYYAKIKTSNKVISSSSIEYQKSYIDDKLIHHIISPFSGYPVNNYESVNVITDDILYSDVYSTAIFLMGLDEAKEFASKNDLSIILFNEKILYKTEDLIYV